MRLVDIDKARKEYSNLTDLTMNDTTLLLTLFSVLDNAPTVEAIPKADYENCLKADMVAMLEDLRLDFQEAELAGVFDNKELIFADEVDDLVQQKINSLKEKIT